MRAPHGADVAAKLHEVHLTRALRSAQNEKRRPVTRTASLEKLTTDNSGYTPGDRAAQRALQHAARRAVALEATAALLAGIGRTEAAHRLHNVAGTLRAVLG